MTTTPTGDAETIEGLRHERDEAREQSASFQAMYRQACDWRDAKIAAAEARALKAESQVAEAMVALGPFASAASFYNGRDEKDVVYTTVHDLRRARSTLASLEPKETDARSLSHADHERKE